MLRVLDERLVLRLVQVLALMSPLILGCVQYEWYECDQQDCSDDRPFRGVQYCDPVAKNAEELAALFRAACQAPHPGGIDKCPGGTLVCSVTCRRLDRNEPCPIIISH